MFTFLVWMGPFETPFVMEVAGSATSTMEVASRLVREGVWYDALPYHTCRQKPVVWYNT